MQTKIISEDNWMVRMLAGAACAAGLFFSIQDGTESTEQNKLLDTDTPIGSYSEKVIRGKVDLDHSQVVEKIMLLVDVQPQNHF